MNSISRALMCTRLSAKQIALFLVVGIIACMIVSCVQREQLPEVKIDQEKVVLYLNQGRYQKVLDEFSEFNWLAIKTPRAIEIYCGALVGSGSHKLPDDFESKAPAHVALFADAYMLLLSGRTESAISKFQTMQKSADESQRVWAELGLFEVGMYTDNLLFSIEPLRALHKLIAHNASSELKEELDFFQANFSLRSGDFHNASKILVETKWFQRQIDAKIMQMQLLLRRNSFEEMSALLESNQSSPLLDYKLMRARLTLYKDGPEQYERHLQALNAEFGNNIDVRLDRLSNKIFWGSQEEKASALKAMVGLMTKERMDYPTALYAANLLFEDSTTEIRDTVKRTIQRAPEPPINFSRYYLLETKIFRHSRQFAAAKKSFEQALAMAPTNMEILREGYLLALDSGAASEAREILKRSLIVEPHAIDIALALIELDITLGKLAEARDLVTALKTNRRYIEPETLKNISSRFSSPVTR